MKIHSNDWEMILNNAHDLSAEYILILIIHYEIALLRRRRSLNMSKLEAKPLETGLLVRELKDVEWDILGTYLGLSQGEIKEIERDHQNTARRRIVRIALCTVNTLGACPVFTPSKLNVQVQLNPKP